MTTQLGDRIRQARELAHLTQDQLAELVGISQQTIGKLELNKIKQPRRIDGIAKALNVDVAWLMTGEGVMKASRSTTDKSIFDNLCKLTESQKKELLKEMMQKIAHNEEICREVAGAVRNYEQVREFA